MKNEKDFLNFQVDHMTLLLRPELYKVAYLIFKVIFGVRPEDLLYEKRRRWQEDGDESSMTFAVRIGRGAHPDPELNNTIIAVVQPSEPETQPSHVRQMLDGHESAALWQHIALRTPDLLTFHEHALKRGVRFITPILKDDEDNLIQVFSGEWYFPGTKPSGMFFEFVERNPSEANLKEIQAKNQETWFRDKTFLGLYGEKQREYDSGEVTPFISFELFDALYNEFRGKQIWEIRDEDVARAEEIMIENASQNG
jgi:hypothetical protein